MGRCYERSERRRSARLLCAGENLNARSRVRPWQRLEAQRQTESGTLLNEVSRWARASRPAAQHAVHRATAGVTYTPRE